MIDATNRALAVRPESGLAAPSRFAFEPDSAASAMELAKWVVKSRLFRSLETPEAVFIVLAQGRERGLTAMQSLAAWDVIDGRLALRAQAIAALVLQSGKARYFRPQGQASPKEATWVTHRAGDAEPASFTVTIEMAEAAGWTRGKEGIKKNWRNPATMLGWRACAALGRLIYPDVLLGVYTADELEDSVAPAPGSVYAEVVREPPALPVASSLDAARSELVVERRAQLRTELGACQRELIALLGREEAARLWADEVGSAREVSEISRLEEMLRQGRRIITEHAVPREVAAPVESEMGVAEVQAPPRELPAAVAEARGRANEDAKGPETLRLQAAYWDAVEALGWTEAEATAEILESLGIGDLQALGKEGLALAVDHFHALAAQKDQEEQT